MFYRHQTIFFILLTILFVGPQLLLHGTNIVTHTYLFGTLQFWSGKTPYADPQGFSDFFKYSPLFAVLYYPLTLLSKNLHAFLWGVINLSVYWFAVTRWFKLSKESSYWMWFAFIACSMELDGSLRYQQINASIVGLSLIGLAEYRKKHFISAAFILALATNIKLLPGLFAFALVFMGNRKYILSLMGFSFLFLLLPALIVGWDTNLAYHTQWAAVILKDGNSSGLLDIATTLNRLGVDHARILSTLPITLVTLALMGWMVLQRSLFNWELWVSSGILFLLLASPRTESPTFVLVGPVYVLLMHLVLQEKSTKYKTLQLALVSLGILLVTLCMNDIWPKAYRHLGLPYNSNKVFGALVLWFSCVIHFLNIYGESYGKNRIGDWWKQRLRTSNVH